MGSRAAVTAAARSRWAPILVLAAVLSLDTADRGTLSATEAALQGELGVGPAVFGVLAAVTPVVGLVLTVPIGVLVDRFSRTRLLAVCAGVWSLGEVLVALAPSVAVLSVGRAVLGVVLAALPAVASLSGDFFPLARRARDYGYVLSGELIGTAIGFLGTGTLGSEAGWRWGFAALAVVGGLVAAAAWWLPEPVRGAQRTSDDPGAGGTLAQRVREQGIRPSPSALPGAPPATMGLRAAVGYVLRVRSNRVLIVVSALTYLFLSGVQTFAVRFGSDQFGLVGGGASAMLVGLGGCAILGVLVTGRIADRLIDRGRVTGRVVVTAATLLISLVCFLPGTLLTSLALAAPLLLVGAAALGGANPPLDAARLDVLHHDAWGRAESVRSVLRLVAYAVAPVLLGTLIGVLGTGPAFAVTTAALALAGGIMALAVRSYPGDVAAAAEPLPARDLPAEDRRPAG